MFPKGEVKEPSGNVYVHAMCTAGLLCPASRSPEPEKPEPRAPESIALPLAASQAPCPPSRSAQRVPKRNEADRPAAQVWPANAHLKSTLQDRPTLQIHILPANVDCCVLLPDVPVLSGFGESGERCGFPLVLKDKMVMSRACPCPPSSCGAAASAGLGLGAQLQSEILHANNSVKQFGRFDRSCSVRNRKQGKGARLCNQRFKRLTKWRNDTHRRSYIRHCAAGGKWCSRNYLK